MFKEGSEDFPKQEQMNECMEKVKKIHILKVNWSTWSFIIWLCNYMIQELCGKYVFVDWYSF